MMHPVTFTRFPWGGTLYVDQQQPEPDLEEKPIDRPTTRFVYGEDWRVITWATDNSKITFRSDAKAIGREVNGQLVGAVIYDNFGKHDCMLHVVSNGSRRWMTREFIVRAFAYPFIQCKFHRVTCAIDITNEPSLTMTMGFGWVQEGTMREASDEGTDLVVFGMLRRECHWLIKARNRRAKRL